jgi:eukaryotic-like serine/threonine-protein kinase
MAELDPLIGRTISGRYRVEKLLGRGGMGKVYQAKQITLEREVALKVLNPTYIGEEDSEFHKRFFHEAAIMAKFTSPHTVTVFDYGQDRNVYFIAMELVSGEPLDRVLAAGPMKPERVIAVAQQVCRSLREAHSKGIVHRDLKPGNVILTTGHEGEELVKLLDFGLAKRMANLDDSNKNVVPGSPKYMSPEVIRQQTVDGRADIYALGVMLYHMLTGVVPFDRENPVDILAAHLNEQPPPLKSVNPSIKVPPALEKLVMRCMAKEPVKRYANMQRVLEALRAAAAEMGYSINSGQLATSLIPPSNTDNEKAPATAPDETKSELKRWIIGLKQHAARILAVGSFILFVLAAGLYFVQIEPPTRGAGKQGSVAPPSAPFPKSATTAGGSASDMVFTVDDLNPQNKSAARRDNRPKKGQTTSVNRAISRPESRVRVELSSEPEGATVTFDGELIGQTPTTFEWWGAVAARGRTLELHFSKPGYYPYVVKKTIDKEKLRIYVTLTANEGAPTAVSPANPAVDQGKKNQAPEVASGPEAEQEESSQEEQASPETDVPGPSTASDRNTEAVSPKGQQTAPEGKVEASAPAPAEIPPASK